MNSTEYKTFWENLLTTARSNSSAKQVYGDFWDFCPHLQYITFDALESKDWPNGINRNSIFVTFTVNMQTGKVELHSNGHVWLTDKDKENPKYKYFAMRSMTEIAATDYGVKKFRKTKFKDMNDLYNKMENYFVAVINALEKHTGGYPYKG